MSRKRFIAQTCCWCGDRDKAASSEYCAICAPSGKVEWPERQDKPIGYDKPREESDVTVRMSETDRVELRSAQSVAEAFVTHPGWLIDPWSDPQLIGGGWRSISAAGCESEGGGLLLSATSNGKFSIDGGVRWCRDIDAPEGWYDSQERRWNAPEIYAHALISRYESALRACIARAGVPDKGDALRLIIQTASDALKLANAVSESRLTVRDMKEVGR